MLVPASLNLYITFMMAFRDVINKCLKMKLAEDWEQSIVHFSAVLDKMKEKFDTIENVKFHILRVSPPPSKKNNNNNLTH